MPSNKKKNFKPPIAKFPVPTYKKLNEENVQKLIQHQDVTPQVEQKKNSSFMTNRSNESEQSKNSKKSKDGLPEWYIDL